MNKLLLVVLSLVLFGIVMGQTKWIVLTESETGNKYYYADLKNDKDTVTFKGKLIRSGQTEELLNDFKLECVQKKAFVLTQETSLYTLTYKKPVELQLDEGTIMTLAFNKFCGKAG